MIECMLPFQDDYGNLLFPYQLNNFISRYHFYRSV